jgi:hypothetical protein
MPMTKVTQSMAAAPTNSAQPSMAAIAATGNSTVGVVHTVATPSEPMEYNKEYDDNGAEAAANMGDVQS